METMRVSLKRTIVTATWAGLGLAWLAALPAALAAVPPAADPDRSAGAVLELPENGFLAGGLVPSTVAGQPPTTLLWKSPLFAKPIEFEAEAVSRVRFPRRSPVARPTDAWRCELEGGDLLVVVLFRDRGSRHENHLVATHRVSLLACGPGPNRGARGCG